MTLVFYGIYFGVMGRDCAELCVDYIAASVTVSWCEREGVGRERKEGGGGGGGGKSSEDKGYVDWSCSTYVYTYVKARL